MIIHIFFIDQENKFFPDFYNYVRRYFQDHEHIFYICGAKEQRLLEEINNKYKSDGKLYTHSDKYAPRLMQDLSNSQAIIMHGHWSPVVSRIFFAFPKLLDKCIWNVWGGDLLNMLHPNYHQMTIDMAIMLSVAKNIPRVNATPLEYYEIIKSINPKAINLFPIHMYPSLINWSTPNEKKWQDIEENRPIKFMIGNSATTSSRHEEAFEVLSTITRDLNYEIHVPLTYGDDHYRRSIVNIGKQKFGERFRPLIQHSPLDAYSKYLAEMHFCIMPHRRQQGFGNIVQILGSSGKLLMCLESPLYRYLSDLGFHIGDYSNLQSYLIDLSKVEQNSDLARDIFSEQRYVNDLKRFFSTDCLIPQ